MKINHYFWPLSFMVEMNFPCSQEVLSLTDFRSNNLYFKTQIISTFIQNNTGALLHHNRDINWDGKFSYSTSDEKHNSIPSKLCRPNFHMNGVTKCTKFLDSSNQKSTYSFFMWIESSGIRWNLTHGCKSFICIGILCKKFIYLMECMWWTLDLPLLWNEVLNLYSVYKLYSAFTF